MPRQTLKCSSSRLELMTRDHQIFHYLWKWKLVTTATIHAKFFIDCTSVRITYKRLRKLMHHGFVNSRYIVDRGYAWHLESKGYHAIKEQLPEQIQDGIGSEAPIHDLIASAIQIGPCPGVTDELEGVSEQQLRQMDPRQYPTWVPRKFSRRPDGYWKVQIESKWRILSLEVEMTKKHREDYEIISHAYAIEESIFRTIWVVQSKLIASNIMKIFESSHPDKARFHNFILVSDLKSMGWDALIILGNEAGQPLSILLQNGVVQNWSKCTTLPNLNLKIIPSEMNIYGRAAKPKNSDCLVFQTSLIPNSNLRSSSFDSKKFISLTPSGNKQPLMKG